MTMKSRQYSSSNNQTPNSDLTLELQDVDSKHASFFSFT